MNYSVHPVGHDEAAKFHRGFSWYFGVLGAAFLIGAAFCAAGVWFHRESSRRHRASHEAGDQ